MIGRLEHRHAGFFQHFTGLDLVRSTNIIAEGDRYLALGFFNHHLTYGGHVMLLLVMAGAWLLFGTAWRLPGAGLLLVWFIGRPGFLHPSNKANS